MLSTLLEFVDRHPQKERGSLNYIPFGGAAVRVLQEDYKNRNNCYLNEPPRAISDVDLLVLNSNKSYPAHSSTLKDVFNTGIHLSLDELLNNICSVNVAGREIVVPNRELLVASKSLFTQAERMKDYDDVALVYPMGIDGAKLADLYEKCLFLPKEGVEMVKALESALDLRMKNKEMGYRFFANFPWKISVLHVFGPERGNASSTIDNYIRTDLGKNGYQLTRVLQDVSCVLEQVPKDKRKEALFGLLLKAKDLHYTEFDDLVHYKIIRALKYSESEPEKIKRLEEFKLI